jgi:hypothetical protein
VTQGRAKIDPRGMTDIFFAQIQKKFHMLNILALGFMVLQKRPKWFSSN